MLVHEKEKYFFLHNPFSSLHVAMTKTFQRLKQCQPTPVVSVLSLESGRIVKFVASVHDGFRLQKKF